MVSFARHYSYIGLADPALRTLKQAAQAGYVCAPKTLKSDLVRCATVRRLSHFPLITQGSSAWQIVSELQPRENEVLIDKITMSAFESTFLTLALRDAQVQAFIIAGIAMEVGIEPTVRHGADMNFIPIVALDACGSKTPEAMGRSLATLKETGEVMLCSIAEIISSLAVH